MAVDAATGILGSEVRELVRRRGLDPVRQPLAIRELIEEALSDYADRSLTGTLPPLMDAPATARSLFDALAGIGPLQRFLEDPEIEEIWVNGPGRVFVARRGRSELTNTILSADQVRDLVERMLKGTGRRIDLSTPFVDATLVDGSRLHVVIPDITREHWAVNIRKFVVRANSLEQLCGLGTISLPAARFLEATVAAGLNVIVSGGTQAGKTTLLNCFGRRGPGQRADHQLRRGFRAAVLRARLGRLADQTAQSGRLRRDTVAAPGKRGAADAAEPDHRWRGPAGRVP